MGAKLKLMLTKKLPILLTKNFFLFPKQEGQLSLEENNYYEKAVLLQACKQSDGNLLIIPNKPELKASKEYSDRGILAKIISNVLFQTESELITSSSLQIQIKGVERIKIVS